MPRSVAQRPVPLLADYIRAPPQSVMRPQMLRRLDSAAFLALAVRVLRYLPPRAPSSNRRLRYSGIPPPPPPPPNPVAV